MSNNRLRNTIRNISWQALFQIMTMTLGVIFPRFIIEAYGSEVNGLTSTIKHMLTLVTLIQAGLGVSASYLLYKPLENHDRVAVECILVSVRRIYRYISLGITVLGLIASALIAFLVKSDIAPLVIFAASAITCLDSAISINFTAASNLYFSASQEKHILSIVSLVTGLMSYALTAVILILKPHFLFMYYSNLLVCIIRTVIQVLIFRKKYAPNKPTEQEAAQVKYVPITGMSYAALNEASHALVYGISTVAVSVVGGLKAASILSIYMMVVNLLSTVASVAHTSFTPSYGSVVAEGNLEKVNRVFEIFQFLFCAMTTFLYMCAAYLFIPFVRIYTQGVSDINYINPPLMVLAVVYGVFYALRVPYNNTVSVTGLFKETCLQPAVCAAIAVVLMFTLPVISFELVLVGQIFFYAANTFYQHWKIPKAYKGFENGHFRNHFAVTVIGVGLAIGAAMLIPIAPESFIGWILYACVTAVVCGIVLAGLILLLDRRSLAVSFDYIKRRLHR